MENENKVMEEESLTVQESAKVSEVETGSEAAVPSEEQPVEEAKEVLTPEAVAHMVNEAEERGYMRGRNEAVEALMDRPTATRRATEPPESGDDEEEDAVMILREMRRSVWE